MKKGTILIAICLLLLGACTDWHKLETHQFVQTDINRHDTSLTGWIYAALRVMKQTI